MTPKILLLPEVLGEGWMKLACPRSELRLDIVLNCGQSFRWKHISSGVWASVLDRDVWILRQNEKEILFKVYSAETDSPISHSEASDADTKRVSRLRDYFQMDLCRLDTLFENWRRFDPGFDSSCEAFRGVRTLRQDPCETLFAFICSANNNVSRISSMVENLCVHYGEYLGIRVEGELPRDFYAFPPIERLAQSGVEEKLRKLGFGYRARYIQSAAQTVESNGGRPWLINLRSAPYDVAKTELMKLCGVGAKVADCVCLMSLDKSGAVPVDTHVWQIAKKHVANRNSRIRSTKRSSVEQTESEITGNDDSVQSDVKKSKLTDSTKNELDELATTISSAKTLTPRTYDAIGQYFRSVWGEEFAGWAQGVYFAADLKPSNEKKSKAKSTVGNKFRAKKKKNT